MLDVGSPRRGYTRLPPSQLGALAQCPHGAGTLRSRRDSPPPYPPQRCSCCPACCPRDRIVLSPSVDTPGYPPRTWERPRNAPTPSVPFGAAVIPLHPIHRGDAVAAPLVTPELESVSPPAWIHQATPLALGCAGAMPLHRRNPSEPAGFPSALSNAEMQSPHRLSPRS